MTQPTHLMGENISTAFGSIVSNYYIANPNDATSLVLAQDLKGSSMVVKYHQDYSRVLEKAVKGLIDNVQGGGATVDTSYLSNTLCNVSNNVTTVTTNVSNVSFTVSNVSNSVTDASTSISNVSNSVTDATTSISNVSNSVTAATTSISNVSNSLTITTNYSVSNTATIGTTLNSSMNTLVSKLQLLEHFCLLVNENMNIQDLTSRQLPRRGVGSLPWAINQYTSSQRALDYDLAAMSIDCPTIASAALPSPTFTPGDYTPINYADFTITKPTPPSGSIFRAIGEPLGTTNWNFYNNVPWTPTGNGGLGYTITPYPEGNLVPIAFDYTFSRVYFIEHDNLPNLVPTSTQPQNLLNVMQLIAYDVKQAPNSSFSVSSYYIRFQRISGPPGGGSNGIVVVPTRISLRKRLPTQSVQYDVVVVDTLTYTDPFSTYSWAANTGVTVEIKYLYTTLLTSGAGFYETTSSFLAALENIPSNTSVISYSKTNALGFDDNARKYISLNTSQAASDAQLMQVIRILQNVPDMSNVNLTFIAPDNSETTYALDNIDADKMTVPPSNRFFTVTSRTTVDLSGSTLYKVRVTVTTPG